MSEHVKKILTLYENGIIDGDPLNNALKAPHASQAQEKTLIDKVREKRRRKRS